MKTDRPGIGKTPFELQFDSGNFSYDEKLTAKKLEDTINSVLMGAKENKNDRPGIGGSTFSLIFDKNWQDYSGDVLAPIYLPVKDYDKSFFSCRETAKWLLKDVYTVKKGKHYAKGLLKRLFNPKYWHYNIKGIKGEFAFLDSYWSEPRNVDDYDKNKIVGLGFGFNHKKNSIRLAFVPHFPRVNSYHVYGYIYDEKTAIHKSYYLCTLLNRIKYEYSITCEDGSYVIEIDERRFHIQNTHEDAKWGKVLVPYMGGDNVAIKDTNFYLTINKF